MCGHATLALGRFAVDQGIVPAVEPTTTVRLQVPAGLVTIAVDVAAGVTGASRYTSMPSYLAVPSVAVEPDGLPPIVVDIAFGGAFYALADASDLGWRLGDRPVAAIREAGTAISAAVRSATDIHHSSAADLGFLYGTILTDGPLGELNVCVFADSQIDRSPTGSGVQARLARDFATGTVDIGEIRRFRSVVGSEFTGRVVATDEVDGHDAVIVEVGGRAYYTGASTFSVEDGDDLAGFVVS
jgi:trans-L-3-hydroxyproline dehydratase